MPTYNATYTLSSTAQPAQVSLLNDKAAIQLFSPEGDRVLYWYYHTIAQTDNNAVFVYTAYPPQTLEVLDATITGALVARLGPGKIKARQQRNRNAASLLAGILIFIAAIYFFLLPWIATALAGRVPVTYEKKLGDEMFRALKQDFDIDEKRSAYASAFFDALQVPSAYNISITVVRGDVANAFAMPGGHIVIYDKLLNSLSSYPQLAALLSHEFIHIQNRHSLKSLFRQASTTLLFATLIGDAGAIGSAVLNSAGNLKALSYSRSLESEADEAGLLLLTKRNIDAAGFVGLFRILGKEDAGSGPEWISSHPQLQKRIRNIQQHAAYKQQKTVPNPALKQLFLKLKTAD